MTMVSLGEIVSIDRTQVNPGSESPDVAYLGLEHIDSDGSILSRPTLGSANVTSSKFRFTPNHILYGKLRPYLRKTARVNFSGVCSTDILPLHPSERVDRDYLYHCLRQDEMVRLATERCSGANLPRLSPSALAEFQIPLPPLAEQRRIAAVLDKADELRQKRSAALARLDQLTQSIFLDMFGDPVTNPKRWPSVPMDSLVRNDDTINYGVVQPGDDAENGVPLIRVGDLIDGRVNHSSLKRISPVIEASYKRSRLRGDEILVSCVGSIGVVATVDESSKGFNIARAVARIPLSHKADRSFLTAYLKTDFVQRYFINELRTVSQPTLNIKQLSATQVLLPPIELQLDFARRVAATENAKVNYRAAQNNHDHLFSSLQQRAFRGELFH